MKKLLYAVVAVALCACGGNTPPATQAEQLAAQIVAQPGLQANLAVNGTKNPANAAFGPRSTSLVSIDGRAVRVCARNAQGMVDAARCGSFRLPPVAAHARQYLPFGLSNRAHAVVAVSERNGELHADLCVLVTNQFKVHCRPVSAPLPQGYDLGYGELADHSPVVTFTPRAGTPRNAVDLMMANRFAVALRAVAKEARALVAATPISTTVRSAMLTVGANQTGFGSFCVGEETSEGGCVPEEEPGDPEPGGGGDPYGDPGTEPDPYPDPGTEPDPYPDTPPETPPPDYPDAPPPDDPAPCVELVANRGTSASLVTSAQIFPIPIPVPPIACPVVIIHGPRPVPDEPRNPAPWFPQSWCDFWHILCSAGQEPRDNDRGADSELSGKTLDELYDMCDSVYDVEMIVCDTNLKIGYLDYPGFKACSNRATERLAACRATARRVTDNGAHVAP